jgi:hypothetical protein
MNQAIPDATLLNRHCFCVGTDVPALQAWLQQDLGRLGLDQPIIESHPHLFSALPVFVSSPQVAAMDRVIAAVESVTSLPAYRAAAVAEAPTVARIPCTAPGGVLAYDFHLDERGASLIEVNTNAGGLVLASEMLRAQRACCDAVLRLTAGIPPLAEDPQSVLDVFRQEWRAARGDADLRRVAILDESPEAQYLFPEFLMYRQLLQSAGMDALIADVSELQITDGVACVRGQAVDLVYNRCTDFYFERPASRGLKEAWESGASVVTPHPAAYALHADKLNLVRLTDENTLHSVGAMESEIRILLEGIPHTRRVAAQDAEELWQQRRQWFFKPRSGFGSRGAYRGDKLTRRAFADVIRGDYVAQRIAPPGERSVAPGTDSESLKVDIRNYVYGGRLLLRAARLYQGQTTNFRTPGGGFAPVFRAPMHDPCLPAPLQSPS